MASRNRKGVEKIQSSGTDPEEVQGEAYSVEKERKGKENVGHGSGSGSDTNNSDSIPVMKFPERVMGATKINGELQYAMKWRGIEKLELVRAEQINLMWPQIAIKFYEENLVWHTGSRNEI